MKKIILAGLIVSIILSCMMCCTCVLGAHRAGEWARDSIDAANTYGIIPLEMYADDYTAPITRKDIAVLIVNACENLHGPMKVWNFPFTDTNGDININKVCTMGIMNGRDDVTFSPDDNVTREEMAKILLGFKAAAENKALELPQNPEPVFSDFESISDWAKPYVAFAKSTGIFSGYDDNTFRCKETVSREMAIVLLLRCSDFNSASKPVVNLLSDGSVVPSSSDISVSVLSEGQAVLYLAGNGTELTRIDCSYPGGKATVSASMLKKNSAYTLFAECNGIFSDAMRFYTDSANISLNVTGPAAGGMYKIAWNRIGGMGAYVVKITERRNSYYKDDIAPNTPVVYSTDTDDFLNVYFNPDRTYTVEISAGHLYEVKEVRVSPVYPEGSEEIRASYPTSKEEADALVTTVEVPVWRISGGKKIPSTASLTVHNKIADKIKMIFAEIYNGPEKFPIKDMGAYAWRGGRTEHNGGTAIDINANENYCIYQNGTAIGAYWKPYEDVYSITPYGDVVRAFEKYGFTWGGDSWRNPKDYMHFSYLGT